MHIRHARETYLTIGRTIARHPRTYPRLFHRSRHKHHGERMSPMPITPARVSAAPRAIAHAAPLATLTRQTLPASRLDTRVPRRHDVRTHLPDRCPPRVHCATRPRRGVVGASAGAAAAGGAHNWPRDVRFAPWREFNAGSTGRRAGGAVCVRGKLIVAATPRRRPGAMVCVETELTPLWGVVSRQMGNNSALGEMKLNFD